MPERLRVLQLPVTYLPWTTGGKEVYCHGLNKKLVEMGVEAHVAIHRNPGFEEPLGRTDFEGVPVHVLPSLPGYEKRTSIYGCKPDAVPGFQSLLKELAPQIVHFHDFSVGANLLHLHHAREFGARIIMTYHSPGQSCLQRALLYRRKTPCDGQIRLLRCTACRFGLPSVVGYLLSFYPCMGLNPERNSLLVRALTARQMTEVFCRTWREAMSLVDVFHVHADWALRLATRNSVPEGKISLIRTGLPHCAKKKAHNRPGRDGPLRVLFAGRCDPVKGVHVLVDAVKKLRRDVPIQVELYGPYWENAYGLKMLSKIDGDRRFLPPQLVEPERIEELMAQADVCIVPSIWLETGPLVVLESFAAGTPVVGSRLGGIAELVRDGVDGFLFEPGDSRDLAGILETLVRLPEKRQRLSENVRPPRTMGDVALDMKALYDDMIHCGREREGVKRQKVFRIK